MSKRDLSPDSLEAQADALLAAADSMDIPDEIPMPGKSSRSGKAAKAARPEADHIMTDEEAKKAGIVRLDDKQVAALPAASWLMGQEKLRELLARGKKKGKLDSGELMEAVDDLNLESDQMDQLYDSLEALNIDIGTEEDLLPELPDDEPAAEDQLADEFYKRSQNYRNVFNPASSFMQPIDDKGVFQPNFSPDDYTAHICESNGWQYFWSVQQDIKGLIALTGGKDRFTEKLDSMFTYIPAGNADLPLFSTGMIGQYAHGNEPSHHVIYLYNKVRQPWKTQKYAAQVMHDLYFNAPAGLCGNEDCGQMSAWYVFSAMGFYPVNPVSGEYEIGTPLFPEIQMHLDNGKTFTVLAPGVSRENIYIQSVKVNGQPYDKSYITHRQIMDGATVEFEMGPEPGNIWYR